MRREVWQLKLQNHSGKKHEELQNIPATYIQSLMGHLI